MQKKESHLWGILLGGAELFALFLFYAPLFYFFI